MTRGLSRQQRQILAMLKTKQFPRKDSSYFSTQEVVREFHPDYALWLAEVENNPFVSNRKHHIDYTRYDKIRVSVYRALRSLEKRGLVVSFTLAQSRFWAVPERLKKRKLSNGRTFHEMDWVKIDREEWEDRRQSWLQAAFIRTLPPDLHLKYKLRILEKEEWEEIKRPWNRGAYLSDMRTREQRAVLEWPEGER